MPTKLHFKIINARGEADRELLRNNLKNLDSVKALHVISHSGYAEATLEVDMNAISKEEIVDVIKISGDFKVEELVVVGDKAGQSAMSDNSEAKTALDNNLSKASFMFGLLAGIGAAALAGSIILGYILFKPDLSKSLGLRGSAAADIWAPTPSPSPAPSAPATGVVQEFKITKDDHIRGDFKAPVTLVEYSDFECPFCGRSYPTFQKLLTDYSGKVRLVYKHFPLTSIHPNAQKAAEASECAAEQGKFWEYHDKLFDNQAGGYSLDKFKQWAKDLNLNANKFNDCLDSSKYAGKVKADEADGQTRGVQGTPATFVNGQLVSGAVPYEEFQAVIDQILK